MFPIFEYTKKKWKRCEFFPSYVGKIKQHQIKAHGSFLFWGTQCFYREMMC